MTKGVLEMKGNKTNKTMRVAGGLLIATLLSTSIVSGTFAKYVTTGSASDSARVAKFGVVVTAEGTLFSKTYLKANDNTPGTTSSEASTLTVVSSNDDKLVAPGTKSDSTGLSFGVTGKPEVDVAISFSVDESASDVWLSAGTYADMTTNKRTASDVFTTSSTYYPIVYTMTYTSNGEEKTVKGSLNDVVSGLNTAFKDKTYKANTDLSTTEISSFNLTWEWKFDESGNKLIDQQDTLLGDLAADADTVTNAISAINKNAKDADKTLVNDVLSAVTAGSGLKPGDSATNTYNLNTNFGFSITVTQVD
jgi:hypothetical protein